MSPTLKDGDIIVGWGGKPKKGSVVVAQYKDKEIIKRLTKINGRTYYLEGDNKSASTDSREFGFLQPEAILGSMKLRFASSTPAPVVKKKQTVYASWIAAMVYVIFALIHLFRIDTFVPLLDQIFPGGRTAAAFVAVAIVVMEVFALPFLMRMRLSPLARAISALFVILVPLFWLLVSIWTYGSIQSTAQLGEFHTLSSNWMLILMNTVWLFFAYALTSVMMPSWSKELRKR